MYLLVKCLLPADNQCINVIALSTCEYFSLNLFKLVDSKEKMKQHKLEYTSKYNCNSLELQNFPAEFGLPWKQEVLQPSKTTCLLFKTTYFYLILLKSPGNNDD